MVYYFDASALVKYYADEPGTPWVIKVCDTRENIIVTARITKAEAAAAFARKYRRGELVERDYDRVMDKISDDFLRNYVLVEATPEVIDLAVTLIRRHKLRGYDAVQLASGVTINNILTQAQRSQVVFVAADNDLLIAARTEGLLVENPNEHSV
jgi:predicted nucleic acid-binding protein